MQRFKEATKTRASNRFRLGSFCFVSIRLGQQHRGSKAETGIACQAPALGHREAASPGSHQVHPPSSFAIYRFPLPSPHHVTAAWTPGLFFPSAQLHRAGASESIHSKCVTMSPGAERLRELPSSAGAARGPEGGGASLGSRTRGRRPARADLPPSAHSRGGEVKLSRAAPAPRLPLPRPGPPRVRTRLGHPLRRTAPSAPHAGSSQPPPPRPLGPRRRAAR